MKKILFLFTVLLVFQACGEKQPADGSADLRSEITKLEDQILETGDASENKDVAKQLVEKSTEFAEQYPENEQTAEVLFKAADVARGAKEYGKAVKLWGQVWRDYPNFEKAPMALFLQGFTFDQDVKDPNLAAQYYEKFLKIFPNNEMVPQVQKLLKVVNTDPNDLIKSFQAQ